MRGAPSPLTSDFGCPVLTYGIKQWESCLVRASIITLGLACQVIFGSAASADLIGITFNSGVMYQISEVDASTTFITNTGIDYWGDLQRAPDGTLYGITTGINYFVSTDSIR